MKKLIPFAVNKSNRTSSNVKDGYLQNMFFERNGDSIDLVKRPAFKLLKATTTIITVSRGMIWCDAAQLYYQLIGDALFSISPNLATVTEIARKTPTSVTWATGTATFVFAAAHGFTAAQIVNVSGVTLDGYNGNKTIASVTTTTVANDTFTVTMSDPGGAGAGTNMRVSPIITLLGRVYFEAANDGGVAVKMLHIPKTSSVASQLFKITGSTVSKVTDADYPTDCVGAGVTIDGYYFVLSQSTTGAKSQVHNSVLETPSSFGALDFIAAETYPDGGVTLTKFHNQLCVMKQNSIEFFYNAANPAQSPLARIDQATLQIGCAAAQSVVNIDNSVIWLSRDQNGGLAIHHLLSGLPQKISTVFIDKILSSTEAIINQGQINAFNVAFDGHRFYVLTINGKAGASNTSVVGFAIVGNMIVGNSGSASNFTRTLVYDLTEKLWHEWTTNDGADVQVSFFGSDAISGPYVSASANYSNGLVIHRDSGDIYEMHPPPIGSANADTYKDGTALIQCKVVTNNIDLGTRNRKQLNRLEVLADRHTAQSNMTIRYSDDDYKTWSTAKTVDLQSRSNIDRLGMFRLRAFEFVHEADTPLRLKSFELDIEALPH